MRYFFVFISIATIWMAAVLIASTAVNQNTNLLFFLVQTITLGLFYLGFYRK